MIELNFLVDDYIDEIKNSAIYQDYVKLTREVNIKYQAEMDELVSLKTKLNEVIKIGKLHPDFKEVTSKYQLARTYFYEQDDVKLQISLEKALENEINNFIKTITMKISDYIPTVNELGFIDKKKGGPSCGSC